MISHTKLAILLSLTLGLTMIAESASAQGLADSSWPMFQHDAQHSGRSDDFRGPRPAPGQKPFEQWKAKLRSRLRGAPAIDASGNVAVGNGKNPLSGFDSATGTQLWQSTNHRAGHADRSQPAAADNGFVYIGARDNKIWGVDPTSTPLSSWTYKAMHDGDITTPPTIGQDGTIYMGSEALGAGWLFAIDPVTHLPKWQAPGHVVLRGSLKNASPALVKCEDIEEADLMPFTNCHDGAGNRIPNRDGILLVSIKTEAIALHPHTGAEIWRVTLAKKGYGSRHPCFAPVVSNDGKTAYFNSKEGLWALDVRDGSPVWSSPFVPKDGQMIQSAAALGADGTLYFGASKKKSATFWALNPDASVRWQHDHSVRGKYSNNQAAVDMDGYVYVSFGKYVFGFDGADGTVLWEIRNRGSIQSGIALGEDDSLYYGSGKYLVKLVSSDPGS